MGLTDNSTAIPRIMVFRPTIEEMKDFSKYLEYMESQGAHKAGLAKIIPPAEWKPRKKGYENIDLMIKAPIQQVVTGGQGLYQQYNIQKKAMSVKEFKKLANSSKYQTPSYFDYEDLERKYWKNVTFNPAIYGADVSGTLTDEDCKEFNINNLNTCLDMINESYGIKIMGVNTAYLYFGMWKSAFAWHTEDMDLYSINFLHFGAPKSWYSIPPEHGKRVERLANGFFPNSYKQCPAFLRHKMTLISPQVLKKYSIPFNKITQEEGEIMITFPYSYHAGYNHGFNCAESTNFALPRWVEFGKRALRCVCRSDSVQISMEAFVKKYQPDRYELWLQGKDIGPDPKDLTHICAAPAPSKYEKDIMSKFNKHKRHPTHKKDYSSDTEEDSDCCDELLQDCALPTKAARKMFENGTESDVMNLEIAAPNIPSISSDTISSMPKPPTISETIHRLHQNLNSSKEKKDKKRKKTSHESTVPPHLLTHSYAKSCVSSCTQPKTQPNSEFNQYLQNDSNVSQITKSFTNIKSESSNTSSNFHSYTSSYNTVLSPLISPQINGVIEDKMQTNTKGSELMINLSNQQMIYQPPPQIKPYYEECLADDHKPSAQPPILKAPDLYDNNNKTYLLNNDLNGLKLPNGSVICNGALNNMVEASTSTDDLEIAFDANSSLQTSSTNNKNTVLDNLIQNNYQYIPLIAGTIPQGFIDEIKFNVCMSTLSPYCAICTLLKPYENDSKYNLSELECWYPPKTSQILIPSIAFTSKVKDETTFLETRETSPLIVCMDCRVCVHSVCYGVSDLLFDGSERNWKCDRCMQKQYFAFCSLCPLRGGPLKETIEVSSEKKWVHISCALLVPDVKFINGIAKKPIDLSDIKITRRTDKMGCVYCRKVNPDNKMVEYFNGYCVQCVKCFTSFHVTCGHRHRVTYEAGDWPTPIVIKCRKCSDSTNNKKRKSLDRLLSDVNINEIVIAKHKNHRFYRGKVLDKVEQVLHHVHFVDNSFTNYVKPSDILNRDCERDPPDIGDPIEVIWNREQLHGKYTGNHSCLMYVIAFDDESRIKTKREDFYLLTEDLPKRVKDKLSEATQATHRQYIQSEESNSLD
ncbi:lysine-specific demethylase 4C-like [Oppia nitens]|uniref:lysine-specific demethylase 4C-like n=1 Tax=Oppia nitens TaxID=1686743 RepID=UPI0023DA8B04|nr:lysine-specific demethylase 4C-like [Oppia nitens]